MAYIGAEPLPGQNREVDDISSSFNGSTTAFTLQVNGLNVSPETPNNILINLGGVLQNPGTDYTIAASTITFTTAPAAGLSFFGLILGAGINTATVADDTIGASKLIDTAVTAGSYTTADITVDAQGRITAAANGTIAEAEIADQAVTNAKVNNSAAIAVSKLANFVTNNADNRIITGSGTANTLNAESEFTFDGSNILCRAGEGGNASLNLIADQGDDNGDGWKIQSEQDENDLTFKSNISGSYVDKLKLKNSGQLECQGNLVVSGTITPTGNVVIPDTIVHDGDSNTKIRFPAADTVSVETGGSERMRITGDGPHLLLGGTSDVNEITESSANAGMVIGGTGFGNAGLAIITSNSGTGRLYFGDNTGSDAGRNRGQINYGHSDDHMRFVTASTERMRIDSSGHFLFSCTSPLDAGDTGIKLYNSSTVPYITDTIDTNASNASFYHLYNKNATNNGYRFYVQANGGVYNFSGNNFNLSDEREKKNITLMGSVYDTFKQFVFKDFNYNSESDSITKKHGLIAQDVELIDSDLVDDGFKTAVDSEGNDVLRKGLKEEQFMMIGLKTLQETITKLEAAEAKITTLETKVAALEAA